MIDGEVDSLETAKHVSLEIGGLLQVEIKGIPSRYPTTFIGMELYEYLIIKEPAFPRKIRVSGF